MSPEVLNRVEGFTASALEEAARHETAGRVRCRILALRQLALERSVAQTAGQFALGRANCTNG